MHNCTFFIYIIWHVVPEEILTSADSENFIDEYLLTKFISPYTWKICIQEWFTLFFNEHEKFAFGKFFLRNTSTPRISLISLIVRFFVLSMSIFCYFYGCLFFVTCAAQFSMHIFLPSWCLLKFPWIYLSNSTMP